MKLVTREEGREGEGREGEREEGGEGILTLFTSNGYLVTLCMGFNRKLLRGRPPVRGSEVHFCSNFLNFGSDDFCWSRRQALSWQPHQRI
jgi:hypothetical protein